MYFFDFGSALTVRWPLTHNTSVFCGAQLAMRFSIFASFSHTSKSRLPAASGCRAFLFSGLERAEMKWPNFASFVHHHHAASRNIYVIKCICRVCLVPGCLKCMRANADQSGWMIWCSKGTKQTMFAVLAIKYINSCIVLNRFSIVLE